MPTVAEHLESDETLLFLSAIGRDGWRQMGVGMVSQSSSERVDIVFI